MEKKSLCNCFNPSAAVKKEAGPQNESSGDKDEDGKAPKKDGLNGEVEEGTNGKGKEGEGAACGSKLRACRRAGTGEGSTAGVSLLQ